MQLPTALLTVYAGMPLWAWLCAGLAVFALIILLAAVAGSGSGHRRWDHSFDLRLADARWFADSLTPVIADRAKGEPELASAWSDGVPRMATLSQQLYELSAVAPSAKKASEPRQLASAVDSLRAALDADVRMRTRGHGPGQDTLLAESAQVVGRRREELDLLLAGHRA